jgi:CheY-like chemotaxis protein
MIRVLVVDDSPLVLTVLQNVLEQAGFHVVLASSAADGLARVLESVPDIVVTDSIMPGMDGFELIRALRSDPMTAQTPVIMLTSASADDPQFARREAPPDAFVSKSADFQPLLTEIRRLLDQPG